AARWHSFHTSRRDGQYDAARARERVLPPRQGAEAVRRVLSRKQGGVLEAGREGPGLFRDGGAEVRRDGIVAVEIRRRFRTGRRRSGRLLAPGPLRGIDRTAD